jgi:hypothetical protein
LARGRGAAGAAEDEAEVPRRVLRDRIRRERERGWSFGVGEKHCAKRKKKNPKMKICLFSLFFTKSPLRCSSFNFN